MFSLYLAICKFSYSEGKILVLIAPFPDLYILQFKLFEPHLDLYESLHDFIAET